MKTTQPVLLALALLSAPAAAPAQFLYTPNADGMTATITGYTGPAGAVAIPAATNGLAVTAIAAGAFENVGTITAITIPATVTNIGEAAFGYCIRLGQITVNPQNPNYSSVNGVLYSKDQKTLIQCPVGGGNFYTISNFVTSIGDGAFAGCTFLSTLTIPTSVTSIGDEAFEDCTWLGSVAIPASVTTIGAEAFEGCTDLGSVTISNGLTSIGDWAFEYCLKIRSVTIPASVTNIGCGAFAGCSYLTGITVAATNPFYSSVNGVLFNKSQTTLLEAPTSTGGAIPSTVTSIGDCAYWFDFNLGSLTMPASVASIGSNAFFNCRLESVTIPAGVTNIGDEAFAFCPSLTGITVDAQNPNYSSVNGVLFDKSQTTLIQHPGGMGGAYTISNGVTTIGDEAFADCQSLTNVTIPASVTNIGTNAFYFCSTLTEITVDASNAFYSSVDGVLFDKNQTTLIQYPGGNVGAYTIPDGVTTIDEGAFDEIVNSPFASVTSVTIPGSVTSIGASTFFGLYNLTNVTLGNGVASIGDRAFEDCGLQGGLTIPASVTNIGRGAFQFEGEFKGSLSLTSVYFLGNAPAIDASVFLEESPTLYYLPGTTGWNSTVASLSPVLWNPLIQTADGNFGFQNNQFGFNITGATNISVVVEACTNLACPVWSALTNLTLTSGAFYFSDCAWSNNPGCFYRLSPP